MDKIMNLEYDTLAFTDAAAEKVVNIIKEENNYKLKLRIFISGGGCSGFQYGVTLDEHVQEGDIVVNNNAATLLIDPTSFQYLQGAEVDFVNELAGSQFVIRNPNASSSCGCGSSFSVE